MTLVPMPRRSLTFPSTKCRPARRGATSPTVPMRTCRRTGFWWTGRITSLSTPRRWIRTPHWTRFTAASIWNIRRLQGTFPLYGGYCGVPAGREQTAYYVDEGADYRQVPEFFSQPEKQLTPDECMTGEQIQTPRGRFYLTDRSREQMEAAGYGFHHQSEDGRVSYYGKRHKGLCHPGQQDSHIKTAEMSTEQNYNMIDGMMNNAPSMEELEAKAKAGNRFPFWMCRGSQGGGQKAQANAQDNTKPKKPSIRAQLAAAKEEQKKKSPAWEKSKRNGGMRNVFHRGRRKPALSVS